MATLCLPPQIFLVTQNSNSMSWYVLITQSIKFFFTLNLTAKKTLGKSGWIFAFWIGASSWVFGGIKSQFISLFFFSPLPIYFPYKLLHFLVNLSGKKEWLVCEKWANFSAFLFTLALATEIWLVVFFQLSPPCVARTFFYFCKDRNKNFKVSLCTRSCFGKKAIMFSWLNHLMQHQITGLGFIKVKILDRQAIFEAKYLTHWST